MKPFLTIVVMLSLALGASLGWATEDDIEASYRRGLELLKPYLVLTDRPAVSTASPRARSEVTEAISLLTKVVRAQPQHWPSYWFIGKGQQALKDHQAAYAAFRRSYDLQPGNPDVGRELVIEAICTDKSQEAVDVAKLISASRPTDAGLAANVGLALLANGKEDEARVSIEHALQMAPSDGVTQALLAEAKAVQQGKARSNYCPP